MPQYGIKSMNELNTADHDLVVLFTEVIKVFDNSILFGYRSPSLQFELFKKGRAMVNSNWIIVDQNKVVTYKDGYNNLSKHNFNPSQAVDAAPYPINWKDEHRLYLFAGFVQGIAYRLFEEGKMSYHIRWGGDWDRDTLVNDETFLDLVHFEIIS